MGSRTTTFLGAWMLVLGCGSGAGAADGPSGGGTTAVMIQPGGGCASCEVVPMAHTRMKSPLHIPQWLEQHCPVPPRSVTLCPGACFGYFPTQWRKWEDVCPIPYAGNYDPLHPSIPPIPSSDSNGKNGTIPIPHSLEPKKMKSSIAPLAVPGTRIN